jgi:hypothetical protein
MFDAGKFNDLIDVPPRCRTGASHTPKVQNPSRPYGKLNKRKRGPERLHLARQVERFKVQP